ncbi:MAG: lantibiotic immunity ABC transporter MutE/EpiE family permease subunit, partial [Streptococcus sp.]|nr:lantibiotic immunity ABC transporter MutE/EpiE family permease subunit [Streptococcus sp.]
VKPMTISLIQALLGTFCIILTSIWNVPLCLWFVKKTGVFATLILNVGMSFILGTLGANTSFWFICPYSWVTRLMVPTLGILPNGEPVTGNALLTPLPLIIMTVCLSLVLLYVISKLTAKSFIKQEVL